MTRKMPFGLRLLLAAILLSSALLLLALGGRIARLDLVTERWEPWMGALAISSVVALLLVPVLLRRAGAAGRRDSKLRGGRDLNTQPPPQSVEVGEHPGTDFGHLRLVAGGEEVLEEVGEQSGCHTVTRPVPGAGPVRSDWVTKALLKALVSWSEKRDPNDLRRALGQLIAVL